MIAEFKT